MVNEPERPLVVFGDGTMAQLFESSLTKDSSTGKWVYVLILRPYACLKRKWGFDNKDFDKNMCLPPRPYFEENVKIINISPRPVMIVSCDFNGGKTELLNWFYEKDMRIDLLQKINYQQELQIAQLFEELRDRTTSLKSSVADASELIKKAAEASRVVVLRGGRNPISPYETQQPEGQDYD